MILYLFINNKLRLRLIPIIWIILNSLLLVLLLTVWISFLLDMMSTTRMQLEQIQGTKGPYLIFVTVILIIILFECFNIVASYIYMKDKTKKGESKDRSDELSSIEEGNNNAEQQQPGCQVSEALSPNCT